MKIKVFIPANIKPMVPIEGQYNKCIIEKEYDCHKVRATNEHLNIYAKTPDNYPELLACFNWDKIIGYEVIEFDKVCCFKTKTTFAGA